jgi:membrane-bound inhibitor of C-type lysozyme
MMRRLLKQRAALLLACVATALITGCVHQSVPDDPGASKPLKVRYACAGGEGLVVEFAVDRTSVRIVPVNGTAIVLPIQPSGSGFRYADARHELRGKGAEAMWVVGRRAPLRCRAVP